MVLSDYEIARRCGFELKAPIDGNSFLDFITAFATDALDENFVPLVSPFDHRLVSKRQVGNESVPIISYGLSSYGYDIRVANEFLLHSPISQYGIGNVVADPKKANNIEYIRLKPDEEGRIIIPPYGFVLCNSVETIAVNRDLLVICIGKSTYARLGLIVNVTPLEPEWRGQITIEISNTTPTPVAVYPNEGIAQLVFFQGSHECLTSYLDRRGKYQNQQGVTIARV